MSERNWAETHWIARSTRGGGRPKSGEVDLGPPVKSGRVRGLGKLHGLLAELAEALVGLEGGWSGLATAAVQGGALIGALIGGYVADRLGRKRVFILTMILFIVLAIAQGFSQNIWDLIIIRFLIGIPLGSDIANGYAYIMESMSKGSREKMGSRWQFMFGLGEVVAILVITVIDR